jgi:transcriptional regulator with XRE-family HTH domain
VATADRTRDNPTYKLLIGLSRFFGVSPTYFFEDPETERGTLPLEVALALRDDAVRDIALRSAGLSERSLKIIADTVTSTRAEEASRPLVRRKPRPAPGPAAGSRGTVLRPLRDCKNNGSVAFPVVTVRDLIRGGCGGGGVRSRRARTSAV